VKKIKAAREDIQIKEKEILKIEEEIVQHRSKMGGMDATQNYVATDRQIKVLENRLEKVLLFINQGFNEI
jgi:predicted dithiol-disulfide oxidoreductase (DUF899 family)